MMMKKYLACWIYAGTVFASLIVTGIVMGWTPTATWFTAVISGCGALVFSIGFGRSRKAMK
jgi:hypothetical protein